MRWRSDIRIGDRSVSAADPTYFIADIAANHDGELGRAKSLIWAAKAAGADCAKFQHFEADKIVSAVGFAELGARSAHQAGWKRSVVEVYDACHTRRSWTDALVATCREAGIDYMTTPYDLEALQTQIEHVPAVKIGSGDITFTDLVQACARTNKPILLATGAADMADVEQAVETVLTLNTALVLLQCNTNYSGSEDNFACVNLRVLQTFALRWPGMVLGLSDHTSGHAAVLGAVALGARVVEKHFTDDNGREGPDHAFALNPHTWREMVDATRQLEAALGTGVKIVERNEAETIVVQRRAIRFRTDVGAGRMISADDLQCLRPCPPGAVDPRHLDRVIGRRLTSAKSAGEAVQWADLSSL